MYYLATLARRFLRQCVYKKNTDAVTKGVALNNFVFIVFLLHVQIVHRLITYDDIIYIEHKHKHTM